MMIKRRFSMNKIRILSALMALLLCLSMLLTACGNKNKGEEPETDATEEVDANEGEASDENKDEGEGEPSAPAQPQAPATVKIADIMNKNWTYVGGNKVVSSMTQAYKGTYNSKSTNYFLVTNDNTNVTDENPNGDSTKKITRVYSLETDKLLAEVKDNETINPTGVSGTSTSYIDNYVHVISNKYFAILEVARDYEDNYPSDSSYFGADCLYDFEYTEWNNNDRTDCYAKYTLKVYNAEGTVVKTVSNDELKALCDDSISYFDSVYSMIIKQFKHESQQGDYDEIADLMINGNKAYRKVKDSDPVLVKDFGVSKKPSFRTGYFTKSGENYLDTYDSAYVVYDKDLNETVRYNFPGYATSKKAFLLANGNLLVQYSVVLADEATEFDYIESNASYELVTLNVHKDDVKQIDVNYYIY
jgi:hypothetical protein